MILSNTYVIPLVILLSLIVLYITFILVQIIIIEKIKFNKRINVKEYINNQEYTDYKNLKREDFSFYSKGNKLIGYKFYYDSPKDKIIIFVNGYNTTTESNIAEINLFASLGYNIYCYDNTGTGKSEGKKFGGTPQSLIDLENCIKEVSKINPNKKITLVGHSMGAHAVSNIINHYDITNIDKIIAISPFNNIYDIVDENIKKTIGKSLILSKTMHKIYLWFKFKKVSTYNTYNTLRYINKPILVIHGDADDIVKPDDFIHHMMTNNNMYVKYLIQENKGHRPLLTYDAINYDLYLRHNISDLQLKYGKQIPEDEIIKLNNNIDYSLKNQLDINVINVIKEFLKEE